MRRRLAALATLFALSSCAGVDPQRVAADRATFDWFAPMTRRYIEADPVMDPAEKAVHLRGIEAWEERVKADEAALGTAR